MFYWDSIDNSKIERRKTRKDETEKSTVKQSQDFNLKKLKPTLVLPAVKNSKLSSQFEESFENKTVTK